MPAVSESPAPRWSSAVSRGGLTTSSESSTSASAGSAALVATTCSAPSAARTRIAVDDRRRVVVGDPPFVDEFLLADLEHVDAACQGLFQWITGQISDDLAAVGAEIDGQPSIRRRRDDRRSGGTAEDGDVGLDALEQHDPVQLVELVTGEWIARHRRGFDAFGRNDGRGRRCRCSPTGGDAANGHALGLDQGPNDRPVSPPNDPHSTTSTPSSATKRLIQNPWPPAWRWTSSAL